MPLPQTQQADLAVQGGQETFRLFQAIESLGDILEINTSSKAFCVGPQSDISKYHLSFFDEQGTDRISAIDLAVGNPVIGRTDAKLATSYPISQLPARIIATPGDLVDNTFLPSTFVGGTDGVFARPAPFADIDWRWHGPGRLLHHRSVLRQELWARNAHQPQQFGGADIRLRCGRRKSVGGCDVFRTSRPQ
jgi:hypothetical protein